MTKRPSSYDRSFFYLLPLLNCLQNDLDRVTLWQLSGHFYDRFPRPCQTALPLLIQSVSYSRQNQ